MIEKFYGGVEGHAPKCEVGRGYYRGSARHALAHGLEDRVGANYDAAQAVRHTAEDKGPLGDWAALTAEGPHQPVSSPARRSYPTPLEAGSANQRARETES